MKATPLAPPINRAQRTPAVIFSQAPAPVSAKPYLGAMLQDMDDATARECQLQDGTGVFVTGVRASSPADKAGLQAGDVVLTFNGKRASCVQQLDAALATLKPGTSVSVQLWRDGKAVEINVLIGEQK